jgi:hypothetical protein
MADDKNDVKLFGIPVFRKEIEKEEKNPEKSFAPEINEDGAAQLEDKYGTWAGGGAFAAYAVDLAGSLKNEIELIKKYRKMANNHEADEAIDDIVNECIVQMNNQPIVELDMGNVDFSTGIKKKINEEFDEVCKLLDLQNKAYHIFRQWYIDGRLYYHKILDEKNPTNGIKKLRRIDPLQMKKVREIKKKPHPKNHNVKILDKIEEYYIFNEKGIEGDVGAFGVRIAPEAVTFVHSGLVDEAGKIIVSNMHKAIRPLNQLRMIEDAAVIYRISRAPERRIFYIDVGTMPTVKAEQYVRDIMNRYKNRLVYDQSTGQIKSDRKHMHMLEDFWLPRREGGRGTEIDTLAGGQNLDQIEDIRYFQKLFYKSLNVPLTRLDPEMGNQLSRGMEITRDELKFQKFCNRLKLQFSKLFLDLLETQLVLKKIITKEEFQKFREDVDFLYAEDSYFTEAKETEVLRERLSLLNDIQEYVGTYYSQEYVRSKILRQSKEDVKEIDKQIKKEADKAKQIEDGGDDDDWNQFSRYTNPPEFAQGSDSGDGAVDSNMETPPTAPNNTDSDEEN